MRTIKSHYYYIKYQHSRTLCESVTSISCFIHVDPLFIISSGEKRKYWFNYSLMYWNPSFIMINTLETRRARGIYAKRSKHYNLIVAFLYHGINSRKLFIYSLFHEVFALHIFFHQTWHIRYFELYWPDRNRKIING